MARKHIGWYLNGRPGGTALKRSLMQVESAAQQLQLIDSYFSAAYRLAA